MEIRTRLAIAFPIITVVPITLIQVAVWGLGNYQMDVFRKAYGLTEQVDSFSGNSLQISSRPTKVAQEEIRVGLQTHPGDPKDTAYLVKVNDDLMKKYVCLIIRRDNEVAYDGDPKQRDDKSIYGDFFGYGEIESEVGGGIYLDGNTQHLTEQIDLKYSDGSSGSIFIVSDMGDYVPEIKSMTWGMLFTGILILLIAGILLTAWVHKSMLKSLGMLQKATNGIKNGNLDFALGVGEEDEIGQIYQDFGEMRIWLKESTGEKIQYDKENKGLINNISHNLKTPATAIKGYAEGIMGGVVFSLEKLDKYIRTIYNKANDMDRLVGELTFYSEIDMNKVPHTFTRINVANYFQDCMEGVELDMESQNIELGHFNYVDEDMTVIVDAEQMRWVINNTTSNSVKYLGKKRDIIDIRTKDVGDFIQVEIEDSGRGIAARDLPSISNRSYRTDPSRNSAKGGSGIGLSIVRKIIEDHDGRIWATGKEGIGAEIRFVLKKYQEVIQE